MFTKRCQRSNASSELTASAGQVSQSSRKGVDVAPNSSAEILKGRKRGSCRGGRNGTRAGRLRSSARRERPCKYDLKLVITRPEFRACAVGRQLKRVMFHFPRACTRYNRIARREHCSRTCVACCAGRTSDAARSCYDGNTRLLGRRRSACRSHRYTAR